MTAQVHGLVSPEERLLTAIEAAQEADRLERAYDVMPPHIQRRINDLRAGRVTVPVPSRSQLVTELVRLRNIRRGEIATLLRLRAERWRLRKAFDRDARRLVNLDVEWHQEIMAATRKRIKEVEGELACRSR